MEEITQLRLFKKNILIILIHTQTLYTNSNIINITYTDRLFNMKHSAALFQDSPNNFNLNCLCQCR
jgi:cell division protein FtsL